MNNKKRLYKSTKDRKLAGVCGGIAEYFDIDPTIVRLIWAAVVLCFGTGLLLYIVAAIVMSDDPGQKTDNEQNYMDVECVVVDEDGPEAEAEDVVNNDMEE